MATDHPKVFNVTDGAAALDSVRLPAMAGRFYPAEPEKLAQVVRDALAEAEARSPNGGPTGGPVPKAIIAPHAGYVYSGAVAASAYIRLRPARESIKRVVLIGPSHRVPLRGFALSRASAYRTPLGDVPTDSAAFTALLSLPQMVILDAAHGTEHSLEVHLPFLQEVLDSFTLVPLVVGQAMPEQVAQVLEALWGGPETLIVISSDLSHYLDYQSAQKLDSATCQAIESLDAGKVGDDQACGCVAVRGLLTVARARGMTVETVDLRNSGDTAGSRQQVVGYGSWLFS